MDRKIVTVKEAQERMKKVAARGVEAEEVSLMDAGGRILAEEIRAWQDNPPFPRSPYDGYAVRAKDIQDAGKETPVCLRVVEKLCAGEYSKQVIGAGEAARIMTGAPIPNGADTVVKQEETDGQEQEVRIRKSQNAYDNYCPAGEDFRKGDLLIEKGTRLDAFRIGIASAAGYHTVKVQKKVKIAVLTTGNELCLPGKTLCPGQIYDSSLYMIAERIRELGGEVVLAEEVPDEEEAIRTSLRKAVGCADLIVTTGGVSVGEKDLVKDVLQQEGADFLFERVLAKPGSPTVCSVLQETLVVSLSGNPFAAAVHMELLVRYAVACLSECKELFPKEESGILMTVFQKACKTDRYIRGREEFGRITIPQDKEKSGILSSMNGCNCLVKIEKGRERIEKGEQVWYIRI